MAPPSAQEIDENGSGAPAPVQVETAITSSGTNHHMLYPRGSHLAPHHPHHPHHVQAAAGQFQAKDRKIDYNFFFYQCLSKKIIVIEKLLLKEMKLFHQSKK